MRPALSAATAVTSQKCQKITKRNYVVRPAKLLEFYERHLMNRNQNSEDNENKLPLHTTYSFWYSFLMEVRVLYAGKFNNNPQGSRTTGRPKDRWCNGVQIAVDAKLKTGMRDQKIELTGKSPLKRRKR